MSVFSNGPNDFDAKKELFRARPKPYPIERRFLLMQAGSAGLALLHARATPRDCRRIARKRRGGIRRERDRAA
jgi:hypothetical protein